MGNQGKVWWNELGTRDVAGSKAFYGKVLGWTFEEMDVGMGPYNVAMHGEGPAGGIFTMEGAQFDGVPQHWMVYFAVDDVDATCAAIRANNGSIRHEPHDIPEVGRIALASDPSGGVFGIIKPADGCSGV
jgi:predicted enzyme related to lactoylglutathione lyase